MSTVFNRIYALQKKNNSQPPTQLQRLEIGTLVAKDYQAHHRHLGYISKINANASDGSFKVLYYPPAYTPFMDKVIETYLQNNPPPPKVKKRKRKPLYSSKPQRPYPGNQNQNGKKISSNRNMG